VNARAAVPEIDEEPADRRVALVDCDIHNRVPSLSALGRFMPARWRDYLTTYGLRAPAAIMFYPRLREFGSRADSRPPSGVPPGADLDFLREQLLDRWDISKGILNPIEQVIIAAQPVEYSAALARAMNDYTLAEWLEPEERLYAGICVAQEDGDLAADEIRRLGSDRRFVQVLLNLRTRDPLGNRRYWKMYEAAVEHDLPVAIHVGGYGGSTITGAGWPSFFYEDHVGYAQGFQEQLISLVCSGAFEAFPTLKIVFVEGGFAWLPPLMWRFDRSAELLASEVPHLRRPPSEYIREHLWFTTQPMEEPEEPGYLIQTLRALDMDDRLLFATDYPHWDFDAPDKALPRSLDPGLRDRIFAANADALYGFEARR
jgi:predicted TIM-barrel fold metal-dependent hydrolase